MSLKQAYLNFLSTPNASALANGNPGVHYVTTTMSVHSASSIISHLRTAKNLYEKKTEKVLFSFETRDSVVLEVETTIEFKAGGGHFLPGLDDNFVTDHTVTFVLIHIVNFQGNLINQIRLYWDQATLLKQLGVIGRSGRNWPIRDGQDQCKLALASASGVSRPSSSSGDSEKDYGRNRATSTASMSSNSSIRPTRDPHSTLSLFAPREAEFETPIKPAIIPPRNSAKPPPRDLSELFVGSDEPTPTAKSFANNGAKSDRIVSPKGGARLDPGRAFDLVGGEDEPPNTNRNPKSIIDPKKYSHFEFGDGEDESSQPQTPPKVKAKSLPKKYSHFEFGDGENEASKAPKATAPPKINSKNSSTWDFADFVTPEKKPARVRKEDIRNFSWSDNEEEDRPAPVKVKKVAIPRKDAAPHFDFKDIEAHEGEAAPLANNVKNLPRREAASQIVIADESPENTRAAKELPADKKAAFKNINAHWAFDDSEHWGGSEQLAGGRKTIYKTAGDGMGGRKQNSSLWDFEDTPNGKSNGNGSKENSQPQAGGRSLRAGTQPTGGFWDF